MRKKRVYAEELIIQINEQIANPSYDPHFLKLKTIELSNLIVLDAFNFNNIESYYGEIAFSQCIFVEHIILLGRQDGSISFHGCRVLKCLHVQGNQQIKHLTIGTSKINQAIFWSSLVKECIIIRSFIVELICAFGVKIENLTFIGIDTSFIGSFKASSSVLKRLYASNFTFKNLLIADSELVSSVYDEISFFNCKFQTISFLEFKNIGKLSFINCKAFRETQSESSISFIHAFMGTTNFSSFDFSAFNQIFLINSHLTDCLFTNTTWNINNIFTFKSSLNDNSMNEYKKSLWRRFFQGKKFYLKRKHDIRYYKLTDTNWETLKEAYKQLKTAFSRQGDIVNERIFYAREMSAYNKTLTFANRTLETKFILTLSELTSNFGTSLLRPLYLFALNLILFLFLVYLGYIKGVSICFNCYKSIEGVAQFFIFLNPFHKTPDNFEGWALIIDTAIRVFSSYAIYNLIRASRRFIS